MSSPAIAGLLVLAPPTLLRHGLLLTLRDAWPERLPTLLAEPSQLPTCLREQPYALLIIDSSAVASALLPSLLAQVRRQRPALPLLLLTGRRPPALLLAGPGRRLPRHAAPAEVLRAATELLDPAPLGLAAVTPAVALRGRSIRAGFSPRELEVLALVVADLCNEQIAERLCLSVRTVESHRRALLQKANVRTFVGLAVRALREGWVTA